MRKMTTLLGLAVGAGALAAAVSPAAGANLCVNAPAGAPGAPCSPPPAPQGPFTTIQQAVDAAATTTESNDSIIVGPGTYNDPVNVSGQIGLTIRGPQFNVNATPGRPGAAEAVIGGAVAVGVTGGERFRIDGFTFSGAGVSIAGGTGAADTTGQVSNNIFTGGATALTFSGSSAPGTPYEIVRNRFDNQATAVNINNATEVDFRDNRIAGATTAGVDVTGGTAVRVFRNSILGHAAAGVRISSTGAAVTGNTITGVPASGSVGVDIAAGSTGTRVGANRFLANPVADIRAPDGTVVDATNNWFGQNAGPQGNDIVGTGVTASPFLTLQLGAAPTSIPSNASSAITARMVRGDGQTETGFPSTGVTFTTTLGTLTPPGVGLSGGVATTTLAANGATGTATVGIVLDSVRGLTTPVVFTPAPSAGAGGGGGTTAARVRLRLTVSAGRRARAGGRVVFAVRANRVIRGQRFTLQRARVVRVRGRTRIVFRNVAARTLNGRTARVTVRFPRAGRYALRVAYREGRTLRRSNAVGITVRPRVRNR